MKIALDVTPAARPYRTGIGWYAAHLADALASALDDGDELLLCTRLSRLRQRDRRPVATGTRTRARWFQAPFGPRGAPQIFHGSDLRLPRRCGAALVASVFDVFSLESPCWAPERFRSRRRALYAEVARRAHRIVFPSEATRCAYLEHFPEAVARGVVVPLGVAPDFSAGAGERVAQVRARHRLPERYVLSVGEVSKRKNLPQQARALATSGAKLIWVWVGPDSYGAESILAEVQRVDGIEMRRLGYLPPTELPALYAGATMLLFASSSEGFGLPALEAMSCGTPVIASKRGSLPEVCGGHALLVDPERPDEIARAIRMIADDEGLALDLRRRGFEWVRRFSWERTARETLAVYRDALSDCD